LQAEYTCPFCRSAIALDDVNVATDLALCRACGKTSSFSIVSGTTEISLDLLYQVPRHISLEKNPYQGTTITYRKFSPILYFLIPFTVLWSGGSLWSIYGSQFIKGHFDLGKSLFGLPFLIGTLILLSVLAFLLFGKWVMTLNKGAGSVFVGIGQLGWTRRFTYNRDSVISLRNSSYEVNDVPQKGILVQNDDTKFMFGSTLSNDAKHYIAATLMQEIRIAPLSTTIF